MSCLLWIKVNVKGGLPPPLASLCPQGSILTPQVAPQPFVILRSLPGSPASSWELTLCSWFSLSWPHLPFLCFQIPKPFLSDVVYLSHLQVTLAQALCHPSSLGSERSPHPLLTVSLMLLLLLNRFSHVQLCATPEMAAHQAPPSLGFSRQKDWSGLPFPSPMHESEKWKWSRSVVSDSQQPHALQPTRLLHPWDFPGKSTGVGCHCYPK